MLVDHVNRSHDARFPKRWEEQAIEMAMQNRWDAAVGVNNQILAAAPNDMGALNRLGRALMELGQYSDAHDAYARTLEISPSNAIAQRNLARLAALQEDANPIAVTAPADPQMFLAEPGKAAVTMVKLTSKAAALAKVAVGERLELVVNKRSLRVRDMRGSPLGTVESRLAHRIIELMDGGNRYDAALLSIVEGNARIVIRETYQDVSQLGKVSFPSQEAVTLPPDLRDGSARDDDDEEVMSESEDTAEEVDDTTSNIEDDISSGRSREDTYFG